MTQLEILKYAAFGLCVKVQKVKEAPMLNEIREQRLAKLEEKRKEVHKMMAELEAMK